MNKKLKHIKNLLANKSPIKSPGDGFRRGADKVVKVSGWPSIQVQKAQEKALAAKNIPLAVAEEALRIPADMLVLVTWAARTLLANNMIVRGTERYFAEDEKHLLKKNGGVKWSRRHPAAAAYLRYYLMLALLVGGGYVGNKIVHKGKTPNKKEINTPPKETSGPIDASAPVSEYIKRFFYPGMIYVAEFETWHDTPKLHSGEARYTVGPGLTWLYAKDTNGKITQSALLSSNLTNAAVGKEALFDQFKMHLEFETYPMIRKHIGANQLTATDGLIDGLFIRGYQRLADVGPVCVALKDAKNMQSKMDAFQKYDARSWNSKWAQGTLKRAWWCACIANGLMGRDEFLDMPRDAFSKIPINKVYRNGHYVHDKLTVDWVLAYVDSVGTKSSVREFLGDFGTGRDAISGYKESGRTVAPPESQEPSIPGQPDIIEKSMSLYNEGIALSKSDPAQAAEKFEQAIKEDIGNLEAYSSLSLMYYKLGRAQNSEEYYEKSAKAAVDCNDQMRKMENDYVIKASSYYNAGRAREAIGDMYKNANPTKAKANYAKAKKNYENSLANINLADEDDRDNIGVYQNAIKNIDNKIATFERDQQNAEKSKKAIQIKSGQDTVKAKVQQKQTPKAPQRARGR